MKEDIQIPWVKENGANPFMDSTIFYVKNYFFWKYFLLEGVIFMRRNLNFTISKEDWLYGGIGTSIVIGIIFAYLYALF